MKETKRERKTGGGREVMRLRDTHTHARRHTNTRKGKRTGRKKKNKKNKKGQEDELEKENEEANTKKRGRRRDKSETGKKKTRTSKCGDCVTVGQSATTEGERRGTPIFLDGQSAGKTDLSKWSPKRRGRGTRGTKKSGNKCDHHNARHREGGEKKGGRLGRRR